MATVSLLDTVRADMGEQGAESYGRVMFAGPCPVCGRRNCAAVDVSADLLLCEHTKTERNKAQYMALNGIETAPEPPKTQEAPDPPPWLPVRASEPPPRKPPLVHGILRKGHVGLLSGKGKSGKSWAMVALCVAAATGGVWFGHKVEKCNVLYIDPEIDPPSLDNRFASVSNAMGANARQVSERVMKWSLRGNPGSTMQHIVGALEKHGGRFGLVVIDSCSCFVVGNENESAEVRRFSAHVQRVASITGAAVFLVHHMGKGNPGDRDAADRARGSSVWLDFPDVVLTLTELFPPTGAAEDYIEDARAFALEEAGQREFEPMQPVHVIYRHPVHVSDDEGITDGWKPRSSQKSAGGASSDMRREKAKARAAECEALIKEAMESQGAKSLTATEAAEICSKRLGAKLLCRTLKDYIRQSETLGVEQTSPQRWKVVLME